MKNLLLRQLSQADLSRLQPHLKARHFKQHAVLFEAERPIKQVYFPTGAVVSLVVSLKTGEMVDYLLPRSTNIRRVFVDNSTTPVSFWVGSNDGASIVKVEPLD